MKARQGSESSHYSSLEVRTTCIERGKGHPWAAVGPSTCDPHSPEGCHISSTAELNQGENCQLSLTPIPPKLQQQTEEPTRFGRAAKQYLTAGPI